MIGCSYGQMVGKIDLIKVQAQSAIQRQNRRRPVFIDKCLFVCASKTQRGKKKQKEKRYRPSHTFTHPEIISLCATYKPLISLICYSNWTSCFVFHVPLLSQKHDHQSSHHGLKKGQDTLLNDLT